jgi:hypothetical protein
MAMRREILLGLLLAAVPGTIGAQRITVHELEQILASSGPAPATDSGADLGLEVDRDIALSTRLATLDLGERLTPTERTQFAAKFKLGPLTRSALELLADRSALLDPPASEFPALPRPDADAQRTMMKQATDFVLKALTHLPDFFALLTTTQFDDGPRIAGGEILDATPGMHRVGSSTREITFSDGKEVFDSSRGTLRPASELRDHGLESQGEFGAEAATVVLDLQQGSIAFHHWESGASGPVAVFRYEVPRGSSHYEVKEACHGKLTFHAQPAYHGSFSIDPANGALVRFTLETTASPGDPITHVASAIEYGAVTLGDRPYICPSRSVAFTVEEADSCHESNRRALRRPVAMLNRIIFSDYHRLGSEVTILPGEQPPVKPDVQGPPKASAPQPTPVPPS